MGLIYSPSNVECLRAMEGTWPIMHVYTFTGLLGESNTNTVLELLALYRTSLIFLRYSLKGAIKYFANQNPQSPLWVGVLVAISNCQCLQITCFQKLVFIVYLSNKEVGHYESPTRVLSPMVWPVYILNVCARLPKEVLDTSCSQCGGCCTLVSSWQWEIWSARSYQRPIVHLWSSTAGSRTAWVSQQSLYKKIIMWWA